MIAAGDELVDLIKKLVKSQWDHRLPAVVDRYIKSKGELTDDDIGWLGDQPTLCAEYEVRKLGVLDTDRIWRLQDGSPWPLGKSPELVEPRAVALFLSILYESNSRELTWPEGPHLHRCKTCGVLRMGRQSNSLYCEKHRPKKERRRYEKRHRDRELDG